MWTCPKCGRIFEKKEQPHSCKTLPLDQHFENKSDAKKLFDFLYRRVEKKIGKCRVISLPCCIHLFGKYDFLAILPKKDGLELRIGLKRKIDSRRLKRSVMMSTSLIKNCIEVKSEEEIDSELIGWLEEAYNLKD